MMLVSVAIPVPVTGVGRDRPPGPSLIGPVATPCSRSKLPPGEMAAPGGWKPAGTLPGFV